MVINMSDPQKNDASAGSEPFVPCYNKKKEKYKFYAPTPIDCGDPKPSDNDPYNMIDAMYRGHIFP